MERNYPMLAADAIVLRPTASGTHSILLVTRKKEPFQGKLAFPGGRIDYGEDPADGCLRELSEECGVQGSSPQLVTVAGKPDRDPRGHTVSIVYWVDVPPEAVVRAGDDAATAEFYPLEQVLAAPQDLAFDHGAILRYALAQRSLL